MTVSVLASTAVTVSTAPLKVNTPGSRRRRDGVGVLAGGLDLLQPLDVFRSNTTMTPERPALMYPRPGP